MFNMTYEVKKKSTLSEHFQNPIKKIVERGRLDSSLTSITSVKCGGAKLT